jgi:hypothetical protein
MADEPTPGVYVVQRLNWRRIAGGYRRIPGSTRLHSHPDFESAEHHRRALERQAREKVNPFACGGAALHHQTSLDEGRLHDWLLDAGVDPPPGGDARDWKGWWEREQTRWTEAQRDAVWSVLDRVKFYEVVECPNRPTVFVVVETHWGYDDSGFVPDHEGGEAVLAFTTRERAEACRAERERRRREEWDRDRSWAGLDLSDRLVLRRDPFDPPPADCRGYRALETYPADEVLFYEVVEVELD